MNSSAKYCAALVVVLSMSLAGAPPASAQQPTAASLDGLCTVTVQLPPAAGRGAAQAPAGGAAGRGGAGAPGRGAGRGAAGAPAPVPADATRLQRLRDDVYVIQNSNDVVANIGQYGGNVTVYLTDEGVILFDSKNDRMHDDIVSKVRSLTDRPIRYVVLTHHHGDHSGGTARMKQIGATVIISRDDRARMGQGNPAGVPQVAYARDANVFLGGKDVQLKEYCGHTRGDTVGYLPAARVVVVGDLVTTPDEIPQIVNYADGGNWTDMVRTLNAVAELDFDFLIGGHGPVLTKPQFLQHLAKVTAIGQRASALVKQGRSQDDITQALLREFNWGTGPAAGVIPGMMVEFR